jgi:hypothetical protein
VLYGYHSNDIKQDREKIIELYKKASEMGILQTI